MTGRTRRHDRLLDRFLEKELDRRRMLGVSLKAGLGGLFAAHLGAGVLGCVTADDDDDAIVDAMVGVAGGDPGDAMATVAAALALTGGLDFVQPGQSVFLKLNANLGDPFPYSTSPQLLEWMVERLAAAGAGTVRCGDSPFYGATSPVFEQNGLAAAASAAGIELVDFRDGDTEWLEIPAEARPDWPDGMRLPVAMTDADHIVNLPPLKTHFIATVTLALKLQVGAVHPADRETALASHDRIEAQVAQINAQLTPSRTVVDASTACVDGGPNPIYSGTRAADLGLALVASDRIACDVVGASILRQFTTDGGLLDLAGPWQLGLIQEARALGGLGIDGPDELDVAFDGVDADLEAAVREDMVRT